MINTTNNIKATIISLLSLLLIVITLQQYNLYQENLNISNNIKHNEYLNDSLIVDYQHQIDGIRLNYRNLVIEDKIHDAIRQGDELKKMKLELIVLEEKYNYIELINKVFLAEGDLLDLKNKELKEKLEKSEKPVPFFVYIFENVSNLLF